MGWQKVLTPQIRMYQGVMAREENSKFPRVSVSPSHLVSNSEHLLEVGGSYSSWADRNQHILIPTGKKILRRGGGILIAHCKIRIPDRNLKVNHMELAKQNHLIIFHLLYFLNYFINKMVTGRKAKEKLISYIRIYFLFSTK